MKSIDSIQQTPDLTHESREVSAADILSDFQYDRVLGKAIARLQREKNGVTDDVCSYCNELIAKQAKKGRQVCSLDIFLEAAITRYTEEARDRASKTVLDSYHTWQAAQHEEITEQYIEDKVAMVLEWLHSGEQDDVEGALRADLGVLEESRMEALVQDVLDQAHNTYAKQSAKSTGA